MTDHRSSTTQDLVNGAVAELAAVGQADFTMEGCARRAYYSIGALYERWPDRDHLLTDVARNSVAVMLRTHLESCPDQSTMIKWLYDDGRGVLLLAGEVMLAGHNNPALKDVSRDMWETLLGGVRRQLPRSVAWYASATAVGNALLDVLGMPGPQPPIGRVEWLLDACRVERLVPSPSSPASEIDAVHLPHVPVPSRSDPVALALIDAARILLEDRGAGAVSTRDIAAGAGVTTGAMYRRYRNKAELLSDVLLTQLDPERYEWTWDLVRALASDGPFESAADVMAARISEVYQNESLQKVLLQVGIAARNDDNLRNQVIDRVMAAHSVRSDMFEHFIAIGLVRPDVAPAVLAWGFQTLPVGLRVLLPLGIDLDETMTSEAMRALMTAASSRP